MGYYSEVGLAIRGEALRQLIDSEDSKVIQDVLDLADDHFKNSDNNHIFVFETIKWYGDDIDLFMKRLDQIENQDDYMFIELGESDDHTDQRGGWWTNDFNFKYVRQLSYDSSDCD